MQAAVFQREFVAARESGNGTNRAVRFPGMAAHNSISDWPMGSVAGAASFVPYVTAACPKLWEDTLTPALRRVRDQRRDAMKTILSALVALSVIASVAGTANALDAKTFFEQVDRDHN
jgi:hypothetical protein